MPKMIRVDAVPQFREPGNTHWYGRESRGILRDTRLVSFVGRNVSCTYCGAVSELKADDMVLMDNQSGTDYEGEYHSIHLWQVKCPNCDRAITFLKD